jgi:hypothetical protein
MSFQNGSEEASGPPKKTDPQGISFIKHAIPHLNEDFGMWRTDLQVYRASAPSPPDLQRCQNGEGSPEAVENRQHTADRGNGEEFNFEDFALTDSDESERGQTPSPGIPIPGAERGRTPPLKIRIPSAADILRRYSNIEEDRGRRRRRSGSSDSKISSSDSSATRRKKKGKYRRERTGSSDNEDHWTRKTYGNLHPKKDDPTETRQKYVDKLLAGRFDGTYEEQVRINRILDQMEDPGKPDLSDSLEDGNDATTPFGNVRPTIENNCGDSFVRDPGPAPRSPAYTRERSSSIEKLLDEIESRARRESEGLIQPSDRWIREEGKVLVNSKPLLSDEDAPYEIETTDVNNHAVVMSAQEISQQALASLESTQSLPLVADEVHDTQPEDVKQPDNEVIADPPRRLKLTYKGSNDCIVNTVQVPSSGINVWMECLPDQNLRPLLENAFSDLHGLSRFHCKPIAHDPIRAYIQATTRPTMHLRINGEKRSSQLQDASEDYAIVRKLAETTGPERWWEFCIEDIHCAICDKLIKDQRRRDRVSCFPIVGVLCGEKWNGNAIGWS